MELKVYINVIRTRVNLSDAWRLLYDIVGVYEPYVNTCPNATWRLLYSIIGVYDVGRVVGLAIKVVLLQHNFIMC